VALLVFQASILSNSPAIEEISSGAFGDLLAKGCRAMGTNQLAVAAVLKSCLKIFLKRYFDNSQTIWYNIKHKANFILVNLLFICIL